MLFNSFEFCVLALCTFGLYYLPFMRKGQVPLLVVASLIFYGWSSFDFLGLLLICITLNSVIRYYINTQPDRARQKLAATLGVILNLATLAIFKYAGLLGQLFFDPASNVGAFLLSIPLPVGISFSTFHSISLLIDVYKDKGKPAEQRLIPAPRTLPGALLQDSFYISFFPQLIAGPIIKAHEFLPQIRTKYWADIRWTDAFRALVTGYFLKIVVADNLAEFTHELSVPSLYMMSNVYRISLLLGYSVQIFADFAGYSLIAIGLCHLFGYRLIKNFDFPYISKSITEFWQRWHISLSTWLRVYLYIPLGGNRKGSARTYLNLMIVMLLGGLWHGAAWSYMVWGGYHGLLLVSERFLGQYIRMPRHGLVDLLRMIVVFVLATLGWLLFKLNDFDHVIQYVQMVLHAPLAWGDLANPRLYHIFLYAIPVFLYHAWYLLRRSPGWAPRLERMEPILLSILLFFTLFNTGLKAEFIYFQF
ncbi:MAG: MBOAT family protein [Bacteroidetes bacterium]|nr:MBOAT family protein [Bacteroidota bacterium]